MSEFIDGDVVRYKPSTDWCRHGIAIISIDDAGKVRANDTYWRSGEYSEVNLEKLDATNIIGNRNSFGAVRYPYQFEDFAEGDKYEIPTGGASGYRMVRKDAIPVPELIEARLRYAIENAESKVRSAQNSLQWAQRELDEFLAKDTQ